MTITTTIKAGESAKTITLNEGRSLVLTGSAGAAGVAYLLDLVLGGTNSTQSWAVGVGALPQIGPYANTQKILLSCSAGSIAAETSDAVVSAPKIASDGVTIQTPSGADAAIAAAVAPRKRMLFIGDSRTQFGQPYRAPGFFDGRTYYITGGNYAGIGGNQWVAYSMMEGTAALNKQGNLASDAAGLLSWAYDGDTPGPKVDVSAGGWFMLKTGTLGVSLLVAIRGAAAKTLNGVAVITNSGFPLTWEYDLRGHIAWVAGALGDTFSDYQAWAIPGASTADIVKFLPQVFATPAEAVVLECGVNNLSDTGSTAAQASAAIADMKTIIDYCRARAQRVYVNDVWQAPNKDATAQKYIDKINTAIRNYCRTVARVRYVGSAAQMVNYSATVSTSKTGVYSSDNLHLLPYGAYKAALNIVAKIRQDYAIDGQHKAALDTWDTTLLTGALNPNPTMVGTTGTGSGSGGVTGTVPTSWGLTRSGSTQTCVGAIEAATDGGPDWFTMTVTGATAADYHNFSSSINPFPSGIALGDYYRVVAELKIGAMQTPGISVLYLACTGNTNLNNIALVQLAPSWPLDTFSTENPVLSLCSEPQKLLDVTTPFTLRLRIGGGVGGGGTIGIRNFRIEKVPGPIYP